jgi:hypothetical protein
VKEMGIAVACCLSISLAELERKCMSGCIKVSQQRSECCGGNEVVQMAHVLLASLNKALLTL